MKKSFRTTVLLVLVLAGMVAWYLVYEKRVRPDQAKAEEQAKQLVSLKQDDIQYLTIERHEPGTTAAPNTVYKFKRTGTEWGMMEPVVDAGNNANITALLGTLTSTKYERIVEESAKDLKTYGLVTPFLKITVSKDTNSPGEVVLVGDDTPVGSAVYAKTGKNETVYKMPGAFKSSLNRKDTELRNRKIISFPRTEITEIEIQKGKESFVLTKGEKDEWSLARENLPADSGEVSKLLTSIVDFSAKTFAAESSSDLSAYGLTPPSVRLTITKGKEKTHQTLLLGSKKDKYFAKRDDRSIVYEVDKEMVEKASRPSTVYRSLDLARFNRFDTRKVRLERGHELLEIAKEESGSGWNLPAEPKFKLDTAKVDSLVAQLQDTKAVKYLTKADAKLLTNPVLVLRVFEKNDKEKPTVKLTFGKKQKDMVPVLREGLDLPFLIKEADFSKINLSKHVLEKTPEAVPPKANIDNKSSGKLFEDGKSIKSPSSEKKS